MVEQTPRGVATVGAQTAVAEDAAAVYYNPAGLTLQYGFSASAGAQVVSTDLSVRPAGGLAPDAFTSVEGREFRVDAVKGTPLTWDIL